MKGLSCFTRMIRWPQSLKHLLSNRGDREKKRFFSFGPDREFFPDWFEKLSVSTWQIDRINGNHLKRLYFLHLQALFGKLECLLKEKASTSAQFLQLIIDELTSTGHLKWATLVVCSMINRLGHFLLSATNTLAYHSTYLL